MTSVTGLATFALVLALAQTAPAPVKPDFSGSWTLDRARSQSAETSTLAITQTTTEVRIESTRNGTSSARVYPFELDAKPSNQGVAADRPRAYWVGPSLVTEGLGNINGQTVSIKETFSFNDARTEMTVESLVIVQHGYSFGGTRNHGTVKHVYTRTR